MYAINKPMPPLIAFFRESGIALTIFVRSPVMVMMIKIIPDTNTAAKPACQEYPNVPQMVKAKNAFNPIPGAWANG